MDRGSVVLKEMCGKVPYDSDTKTSLRKHNTEVSELLRKDINDSVRDGGLEVEQFRINDLSYAPEVAASMLMKQQAKATIAARKLIVEGAVDMVHDALERLEKKNIKLDDIGKQQLASNMLVVLSNNESPKTTLQLNQDK